MMSLCRPDARHRENLRELLCVRHSSSLPCPHLLEGKNEFREQCRRVVIACVEAINKGDFKTARQYVRMTCHSLGSWAHVRGHTLTSTTWSGCSLNTM